MPYLDYIASETSPRTGMVEMELGMSAVYKGLIGERIKNKLIKYAYDLEYKGAHDDLVDQIEMLAPVVEIVKKSIIDVIQGEVEVLATRDEAKSKTYTMFMSGLLHAKEIIKNDDSLIGKIDLE